MEESLKRKILTAAGVMSNCQQNVLDAEQPPRVWKREAEALGGIEEFFTNDDLERDRQVIENLLRNYPVAWTGFLRLKNYEAHVKMFYSSGSASLANKVLPLAINGQLPTLKVTQRLKMEPQELVGLEEKLLLKDQHSILLALPCGVNLERRDGRKHVFNLRKNFINYFKNKNAAGIVTVSFPDEPNYVIHLIPDGDYVHEKLPIFPIFLETAMQLPYLVIIITTLVTINR